MSYWRCLNCSSKNVQPKSDNSLCALCNLHLSQGKAIWHKPKIVKRKRKKVTRLRVGRWRKPKILRSIGRKKNYSLLDKEIIWLYRNWWSVPQIAKLLKCSSYKVRQILKDNNVRMRPSWMKAIPSPKPIDEMNNPA